MKLHYIASTALAFISYLCFRNAILSKKEIKLSLLTDTVKYNNPSFLRKEYTQWNCKFQEKSFKKLKDINN